MVIQFAKGIGVNVQNQIANCRAIMQLCPLMQNQYQNILDDLKKINGFNIRGVRNNLLFRAVSSTGVCQ